MTTARHRRVPGRRTLLRRIWLPAPVYAAMPWVYCLLGGAALLSGLFLPHPAWLAPYLLLLAVSTVHAGVRVLLLRRRYRVARARQRRRARPAPQSGTALAARPATTQGAAPAASLPASLPARLA